MSAQTSLCHLPKLLWILIMAVSVEAYTSCRMVEMTFAPRRNLAGKARAAIWQSHQGHFTHLTFTCLHAVNITPGLCGWSLRTLTSRGRNRERRAWETAEEREKFSWETFCVKKKPGYLSINHTAGLQCLRPPLVKFTIFSQTKFW